MAWEWVAPVAAATGASVGAITTLLAARAGRNHATELLKESAAANARMAMYERQQNRYEEAYIEILVIVERTGAWIQSLRPIPSEDLDPRIVTPESAELDASGMSRANALVAAYGSGKVRHLLHEYFASALDLLAAEANLRNLERGEPAGPWSKAEYHNHWSSVIVRKKPDEKMRREELTQQISCELQNSPDSITGKFD